MKMKTAMDIIETAEKGYMVSFEKLEGQILAGDHFPDKHAGEKLIISEETAWKLATRFANATDPDRIVNIYVTDQDFAPVKGYAGKIIRRR